MQHAEQRVANASLCKVTQKFSHSKRIHRSDEFERILKSKAITNRWVALHSSKNEVGLDRLGVIVGKRVASKAVTRNRIKRVIRETFRLSLAESGNAIDIIIRVKRPLISSENQEFRLALSRLLINARLANQ